MNSSVPEPVRTPAEPAEPARPIDKPPKPYPNFPLSPANCGAWQKKINGKIYYFGKWGTVVNGVLTRIREDGCWQEALTLFEVQRDDLYAGRRPRGRKPKGEPAADELTVKALCNRFLNAKRRKMEAGELSQRSMLEYVQTGQFLADSFGADRPVADLAGDDFEELRAAMSKRWGPVRLGNSISRIRSFFKYGFDNGLCPMPRYGSEFAKPDKSVMRRHRAKAGEKMFEAEQVRQLLGLPPWAPTNPQLAAMILLGVNCGFGNTDVAELPLCAVHLDAGRIDFPRPKTGVARRCPLWPETVAALKAVIANRPQADKDAAERVFVMSTGRAWVRVTDKSRTDNVSVHFGGLLKRAGLHREGLNFYGLRHTFRTIADGARDSVACDLIMGHADHSIADRYRERVDDARLIAVTNHVRDWLFGKPSDGDGAKGEGEGEAAEPRAANRRKAMPKPKPEGVARPQLKLYVG